MKSLAIAAVLAIASAAALPAPAASAADDARFGATTLDLSAQGEAKAPPDMATIALGVTTNAANAADAMSQNAVAMTRVVAALKTGGIDARDIATSQLSLNPTYVYPQGQPAKLTGYEASNQVMVTVDDLSRLGAVVDAVTNAGATNIGQIAFGLKNPVSAQNEARFAAVKALQDKATIYADALGYHIQRLVNVSEGGGYSVTPPRSMVVMAARVQAVPVTPVETGDMTVSVDITGEFELTH